MKQIWFFPTPSIPQPQMMNNGPSVADMAAQEQQAADEAARKSRLDAQNRQGSRQNILADPNLMNTFGSTPTARKNLLGATV